jgi:hypothetical protein
VAGTLPTATITVTRRPLLVWTYPARLLPSSITWIVGEPTARLPVLSWACPATGDFGEDVGQGAVTAEDREGVVQGPAVAGRRDAPEKDCHRRRSGSPLVIRTCSIVGKDAHGRKAELRDRGQLAGSCCWVRSSTTWATCSNPEPMARDRAEHCLPELHPRLVYSTGSDDGLRRFLNLVSPPGLTRSASLRHRVHQ